MSYVWRTMEDDKVRPSHALLNGLVLDDNFRPEPGEEYGCRCVRETVQGEDDDDIGGAPNPSDPRTPFSATDAFGSFVKTAAIGTGISIAAQGFKNILEPALAKTVLGNLLNKVPGTGSFLSNNKVTLAFTAINLFSDTGQSTIEKLGQAAISIGVGIVSKRLGPVGLLVGPTISLVEGLFQGKSSLEIGANIAGGFAGRAVGKKIGGQIFSSSTPSEVTTPKYNVVNAPKREVGMFGMPVEPKTDINTIKTIKQNISSSRTRAAPVMEKRLKQLANALNTKNKGKVF